jgi:hypothetical protein
MIRRFKYLILFVAAAIVAGFFPRLSIFGLNWYGIAWIINLILVMVIVGEIGKDKEEDPNWDWVPGRRPRLRLSKVKNVLLDKL